MIAHLGINEQTTQFAQRYGVKECALILDVDFRCVVKARDRLLTANS